MSAGAARGSLYAMSAQPAARGVESPSVGDHAALAPGWWAAGLALHERPNRPVAPPANQSPDAAYDARRRLEHWRAAHGLGATGQFTRRLRDAGLDEAALLNLLAEPPASLAARADTPPWADPVERAVGDAPTAPAAPPAGTSWQAAFAVPLGPLAARARRGLLGAVGGLFDPDAADLAGIADGFEADLGRRLAGLAARTFVLELNVRRVAGQLRGEDPHQRFADFVRRQATPAGLAALLTEYPVLGRLLGDACRLAVAAQVELLRRYAADREDVVDTLLAGSRPGPLVAVRAGLGDPHRGGRTVSQLLFADGRQVVYKPRDPTVHLRFTEIVGWLNRAVPGIDLRTVAAVPRAGYGWFEHIPYRPCRGPDEVERFYRRQGALLALLHAVRACDMHYGNLVACGDQPVLVDTETLFHPSMPLAADTGDPAARALVESVYRTALLPQPVIGENGAADLSGLGGERGQLLPTNAADWDSPATDEMRLTRSPVEFAGGDNRPRLGERVVDVRDYEVCLIRGFRAAYDALVRYRDEFLALLDRCADDEVRIVVRPTRLYATMLNESTHPDVLRDALDRDQLFDLLWAASYADPLRERLVGHEIAAMWAGDVPLFTARAAGADLHAAGGRRLPAALPVSGLASARAVVSRMGEVDRREQEWIVSATLATLTSRHPPQHHLAADPVPGSLTASAAEPARLLAAACGVADEIVARGVRNDDRVNWLGLELVDEDRWVVLPMGAGLANGYCGVALFLAQLAEITGVARYAELARLAVGAVPRVLDALAGQADVVRAVGCGGWHGFGGISYALARLSTLLGDADTGRWAAHAAELAAAATDDSPPGFATGLAGCAAAMTAVHDELGLPAAARVARRCAERLAGQVPATGPDAAGGFANGLAGIAYGLARCGEVRRTADLSASDAVGPGWCEGAAGRLAAAGALDPDADLLVRAVSLVTDRPVLRDLSLCHGEFGVLEAVTALAERSGPTIGPAGTCPPADRALRRRAGLVLNAIERYGAHCGVPGGLATPGLLTGLAGIGYGLLRLGFADRVPSVLLLEPTPATGVHRTV
jgi:type 2 lantibiotic biosynthesis protein LanM